MPDKDRTCALCGEDKEEHVLANFADGIQVGEAFLVCPTSVFLSIAEKDRYQAEVAHEAEAHEKASQTTD